MRITFHRFGENAILLNWPAKIDPTIHTAIVGINALIQHEWKYELIETVITYHSLTLYFSAPYDFEKQVKKIQAVITHYLPQKSERAKLWKIPVCYDRSFGWDLEELSEIKKMSIVELVRLHTTPIYHLYFIGFLPGFLYLGGLDDKLMSERKIIPRAHIEAGSVAIGGHQTGIYPQNSPGGWQIIGKTPCSLFDIRKDPPSAFSAGDKIQFYPITLNEFEVFKKEDRTLNPILC